MAAWSILLGLLAVVFTGLGVLATPIPVLGAFFAFGAPALALAGVITGGVGMSRARREGKPSDGATAGIVIGALAFFPALITALTCGVCNALCSSGEMQQRSFRYSTGLGADVDGGTAFPAPPPLPPPQPASPQPSKQPGSAPPAPKPAAPPPDAPPPAFPPPPLSP